MNLFRRTKGKNTELSGIGYRRMPLVIAATYFVVSALWIAFSDGLATMLVSGYDRYQTLQTLKGWLFVAVTAGLLFLALRSIYSRLMDAYRRAHHSEQQLELALKCAGGGIWDYDLLPGSHLYISRQIRDIVGLSANQPFTLDDWSAMIPDEDDRKLKSSVEAAIASRGEQAHDVRYRIRATDGTFRWLHSRGRVICDSHGIPVRMVGVIMDETAQVLAEERANHLMHYDPLTGLANRATFIEQLDEILRDATANGEKVAVIQIVLDDFNEIFDELGDERSNEVIQAVGRRLARLGSAAALAGRLGQDSFAVAIRPPGTVDGTDKAIKSLAEALNRPILAGRRRISASFSIGAALGLQDGDTAQVLIANSGRALAKQKGPHHEPVQWFTAGMDVEFRQRTKRLRDLREAVRKNQFECHFQPIIGLTAGRTIGFEALVRWRRPGEGLVPPDQFIPLAEESGHIHAIGEQVLREACRQAQSWRRPDGGLPFVAVNVSPRQLEDPAFPSLVEDILRETGLAPVRLELEVTENAVMADFEAARHRLETLQRLGISIAIDDFGTGHSSLSKLARLAFDRIKIDRSFVAEFGTKAETTAIVEAILSLSGALGLDITAEGIETLEHAELLRGHGVGAAQGFYFGRPVPAADAAGFLERGWLIKPRTELPDELLESRRA